MSFFGKVGEKLTDWLTAETETPRSFPLSDFDRIQYELRPCDVLLFEGRSRVARVIKLITQSTWSHAALYIGRLHDIESKKLRDHLKLFYHGEPEVQLIIESILGKGIIVSPLTKYKEDHIRICRPKGISRMDAQEVIGYAIEHLGTKYDVRQILDLARFLFPWTILPRRWRTSLFTANVGGTIRESCSSLLAEAFHKVGFPILPVFKRLPEDQVELLQRSPKLFTPSDFDYSPFFEIIKYPILEIADSLAYRKLPWKQGVYSDDDGKQYEFGPITNVQAQEKKEQDDNVNPSETKNKTKPTSDFFD